MNRLQIINLRVLFVFLAILAAFEYAYGSERARYSARSLPLSIHYTCPIEETGNAEMIRHLNDILVSADRRVTDSNDLDATINREVAPKLEQELSQWTITVEFFAPDSEDIHALELGQDLSTEATDMLKLLSLINPARAEETAGISLGSKCEFGVCPERGPKKFIPTRDGDYTDENWVDDRWKHTNIRYSRVMEDGEKRTFEIEVAETLLARLPSFNDYRNQSTLRSWAKRFSAASHACIFQHICGPGQQERSEFADRTIKLDSVKKARGEFELLLDKLRERALLQNP